MRAAEVVGPYGKLPQPPWGAARSGAFAPAVARKGWELARRASKKGKVAATAGGALSEAESAERAAGQMQGFTR